MGRPMILTIAAGITIFFAYVLWQNAKDETELAARATPPAQTCKTSTQPGSPAQAQSFLPRSYTAEREPLCITVIAEKWSAKHYRSPDVYISNFTRVFGCGHTDIEELNDLWFEKLLELHAKKYGMPKAEMMMNELRANNKCH
jgi:hypothetical protein